MNVPRVIIAGISSGCGKTTVTTGLMGALSSTGLKIQGFKIGPDFIDPSYHSLVTKRRSRNLDTWMLPEETILGLFRQNTEGCDIAVTEGVMGLFDDADGMRGKASTAYMAKLLRSPVILVIDVWGMAGSAAAIVAGCRVLDKGLNLAGAILNKVSGEKHTKMCKDAIESTTGIPVVGALPKNPEVKLPERHLGLVPTSERPELKESLGRISEFVKANVELDRVLEIAKSASSLREVTLKRRERAKVVKIGVARDEAFNFYYQDGLDTLSSTGAEIAYFSPIHDKDIPGEFDGLYIGGGFPEVLARDLEANQTFRSSLKKRAEEGMPVFAECGGLMYLTKSISNFEGGRHSMVGILDAETQMVRKLTLSYTDASVVRENVLARPGSSVKGHEFHFSKLLDIPSDARFAYEMKRGAGIDGRRDGWIEHSVLAQYAHTHIAAAPMHASHFIRACLAYKRRMN